MNEINHKKTDTHFELSQFVCVFFFSLTFDKRFFSNYYEYYSHINYKRKMKKTQIKMWASTESVFLFHADVHTWRK